MAYRDLRHWLEAVEGYGELRRFEGVDTDLEMGGIVEIVHREGREPIPTIMFDAIPGYPKGHRTLFGLMSSLRRIAMALGLPEDQIDRATLLQNWRVKSKTIQLIPPKVVKSGPVQQNLMSGDQVDLLRLPSLRHHELDGGRYIGTCHAVIQKDPDTGWVNLGTYRVMLVDRNRVTLHIVEGQHGRMIMDSKYFDHGRVMPVAIAIGMHPALTFASQHTGVHWGVSEYDYAGGIVGQPVEVIEGPYSGLPLPATAEIVLEGECHPGDLVDEGPFGEWCGYYSNLRLESVPEPVMRVKAVHYRDDPILTCSQVAAPPEDTGLMDAIRYSAGIWERLEAANVPGVKGVWCHELGTGRLFTVISLEQIYTGQSLQAGLVASQYPVSCGRYTVVVDDDIDPCNLEQVIWAIGTRTDPERSIQILHHCRSASSDPAIPLEEKKRYKVAPKPLYTSRAIIDACQPLERKADWYPVAKVSPKLRSTILEKWKELQELL